MKLDIYKKKTGICFICGKPTKLLIHNECGKSVDKLKKETIAAEFNGNKITVQQKETANHNRKKKDYINGCVPKFCYE